ncbi:GNAT family N-acetyltransferase [Companilactobacillus ginsenosidimutans]|uniref:N-acetyltransferase domain-containing protein n=1 Tax=Companilactobacillus ginsenosidimutans TaxID=1007676 RepID=A0A0H4QIF5_9LACO|nr:GNAT family protein [Companilactobacillus ginsenosidimutans]AKP67727.1 hypothetical protein ABM34_09440 [Companilactobacillus ginsenosidimutans]
MNKYTVDKYIELRIAEPGDAEDLFHLIDDNRQEMEKYMPWTKETVKISDEDRFLKYCQKRYKVSQLWPMTIIVDGKIAGMFDFHNIDHEDRHCDIGYWLGKEFQHNGVMTKVVKTATEIGHGELGIHRIQIMAVVDNVSSNNVAKNAGFTLESTLKEYAFDSEKYHNMNIYSHILD